MSFIINISSRATFSSENSISLKKVNLNIIYENFLLRLTNLLTDTVQNCKTSIPTVNSDKKHKMDMGRVAFFKTGPECRRKVGFSKTEIVVKVQEIILIFRCIDCCSQFIKVYR